MPKMSTALPRAFSPVRAAILPRPRADAEIEQDAADDKRQVLDVPPAVEKQRGEDQPGRGGRRKSASVQEKIDCHGDRKKKNDILEGIEKHQLPHLLTLFVFGLRLQDQCL